MLVRVAVACAIVAAAFGPPTAHADAPSALFGINAQEVFRPGAPDPAPHVGAMARLGIGVVRKDAHWSDAEPVAPVGDQHVYRWERHDRIAESLARGGLRWYPIIDYATGWAGTIDGPRRWISAPRSAAEFAAYAGAFAARYGSGGDFWRERPDLAHLPVRDYEIWNEPNVERFWPGQRTAPERYAELFVTARSAIQRSDSAGRVIVGGLSARGMSRFVRGIVSAQPALARGVDGVAFHPYGGAPAITLSRVARLRALLDDVFDVPVPIEVTELGIAVPPATEQRRASAIRDVVRGLTDSDCGVTRIILHTWIGAERDPSDPEQWFGLANPDGSWKPSAAAYAAAIGHAADGRATAARPCGRIPAPSRARFLR